MAAPVVHVEVRGLGSEELQAFYGDIFGWRRDEARSVDGYNVCSLGTVEVTAATGGVPDWSAMSATFYIQVDDIAATLEAIEQRGGRRVMDRQAGPPDFPSPHINVFTKFVDPAGNVVGLVEAVPA